MKNTTNMKNAAYLVTYKGVHYPNIRLAARQAGILTKSLHKSILRNFERSNNNTDTITVTVLGFEFTAKRFF